MTQYEDNWDWSDGESGSEHNEWLPKTGTHIVKVVAARKFYANSGTPGIELVMADKHGRKMKDTLWNTKNSINRNWNICTTLGLPPDVIKHITPEAFIGRYCKITTAPDGKYTKVDMWEHWAPKDGSEAFDPVLIKPEEERWTPDAANTDTPFNGKKPFDKDDVPF